jgi:regulatory protein
MAGLHDAAMAHLARYATTQAGLARVLDRRVERWARATGAEAETVAQARAAVRAVVARLVAAGLVDDAAFAASRARRLTQGGRSRRAVAAHLAARGVAGDAVRAALPEDGQTELAAAAAFVRRRRIGPFRAGVADAEGALRELAMMARAGFDRETAIRALGLDAAAAEDLVIGLRRA